VLLVDLRVNGDGKTAAPLQAFKIGATCGDFDRGSQAAAGVKPTAALLRESAGKGD
jgi:hypothetical protein